jgi:branched-chain amino acid transport system substrate-binding protein
MRAGPQWRWSGVLLFFTLGAGGPALLAQTNPPDVQPYATMEATKVDYWGAGREKQNDFSGPAVHIGILLPLQGKRALEGKLLLQAAQISIDEENRANPPAKGQQFVLAVEDESGPWGQASGAMIHLILQDEAVALITSTDGNIAHQAEQIANKVGIPIVTLSSDPTTTRINIPWIFRVGPNDAEQAKVLAERIYGENKIHNVMLITETGHDGRIGGQEFGKAANSLNSVVPHIVEVSSEDSASLTELSQELTSSKPDAVVLWTGSGLAKQLFSLIRHLAPSTAIYLCQKAAELFVLSNPNAKGQHGLMFVIGPEGGDGEFMAEYRQKTGETPGIAAQQVHEAIRTIASAVRRAGTNRARIRDRLAAGTMDESTAKVLVFDPAGNSRNKSILVNVELREPALLP